jgi:hypothetical protein
MSNINKKHFYSDPAPKRSIKPLVQYFIPTDILPRDGKNNDIHTPLTVSWNNKIEQNIKEIGEKAKGYKIMHIQESRKISQMYKNLMITGIALGPLAGLLSAIGAVINPSNAPVEMPIAATCVAFISGIVIAITKYGKFEEKSSHHKIAASKYTSIESNVRRQLVLRRDDRINAVQYLEYVGSNFDELFLVSPLVTKRIYEDYVKIAKESGLIVPDEYGLTINVDEHYQRNKLNEMKNVSVININESDEIEINIEPLKSITPSPVSDKKRRISLDETLKGTKELKRTGNFTHFPELNKFSDGRMEYEMQRMMGLK